MSRSAVPGSATVRASAVLVVMTMVIAGCSIETSTDQIAATNADSAVPTSEPATSKTASTPTAEDEPTSEPAPTATQAEPAPTVAQVEPAPEPESEPSDEEPVDTSAVVVDGGDWVITQNEVDELIVFVEETHELSFTDPVGVVVSADIGLEFARGFEPFGEPEWFLMRGLGMASGEAERLEANQLRLDRIRGFCCTANSDGQAVVVELQATKFATALIVVHELVHAVHTQNPDLRPRGLDTVETPFPAAAAFEGVPQFITFEFMKSGSAADRAAVDPDLPIIRDDMLDQIQAGAARHLNFAYDTGPAFVDGVVAERGVQGLSELMMSPPTTTEQVLFPEKYLAGEEAVRVDQPDRPSGARTKAIGSIGSAMLWFLLAEDYGPETAQDLVEPWAGDTYVVYELDGQVCLRANIMMDTDDFASSFAEQLTASIESVSAGAQVDASISDSLIELQACHPS